MNFFFNKSLSVWLAIFFCNPSGYAQVLEEGSNGTLTKVYAYGLDLITQRTISGNVLNYYGYDGNGNTRFLTGTNAAVTDTYVYEAFGTVITNTGSTLNNYRYTGEQFDPNLGFYYLRARYSNPNTGRFISRDSYAGNIYDPPSLHRYLYTRNDPANRVDPSGNADFTLPGINVAGAIQASLAAIVLSALATAFVKSKVRVDTISLSRRENDSLFF